MKITVGATGLNSDRSGSPLAGIDLCGTADRVSGAMVAAIQANKFARIQYPQDSLGGKDPCAMMGAAAGDTLLNAKGQRSRGGHTCIWSAESSTDTPWAILGMRLAKPDSWRQPIFGGSKVTIDGRDSTLARPALETPSIYCIVATGGKTWDTWPGYQVPDSSAPSGKAASRTEVLEITVFLPSGTVDQACQQAQGYAAKLWPQLPRP